MVSYVCKKCTVVCPPPMHKYDIYYMCTCTIAFICGAGFLKVCMPIHINMYKCEHIHVQKLSMCNVVCTFLVCMNLGIGAYIYMLMCTCMPCVTVHMYRHPNVCAHVGMYAVRQI